MRRAVTIVELLVVLAVIAGMLALLLPAVQNARNAARLGVCKNRIRQVDIAARTLWETGQPPPEPLGDWPVAILPWIEEQPLADQMELGPRDAWSRDHWPLLLRCPFQPAGAADQRHYGWVVGSLPQPGDDWPFPTFQDTAEIDAGATTARDWFDGAVLLRAEADTLVESGRGPHPMGGVHQAFNGQTVNVLVP